MFRYFRIWVLTSGNIEKTAPLVFSHKAALERYLHREENINCLYIYIPSTTKNVLKAKGGRKKKLDFI